MCLGMVAPCGRCWNRGLMLLGTQVAAGHRGGGVLRSGGGGEDGQLGSLGVLQPPLTLAARVLGGLHGL